MSWDPLAWARSTDVPAGAEQPATPPGPMPAGGVVALERNSWLARVQPTAAIGAVELELRAAGWTLGPLPELAERMPVVSAITTDQPSLAGSGGGFASLRFDESSHGIRLRIRPLPAAQAGCAVLLPDFGAGVAALRQLAQSGLLPEEAVVLDRSAMELWLGAAEVDAQTSSLLLPQDSLLLMIATGPSGGASERIARAAASLTDLGAETLGQDVAQAWAATRSRVADAVSVLHAAGWELGRREARLAWDDPIERPPTAGAWVGLEATGADPHSLLLRARRLDTAT